MDAQETGVYTAAIITAVVVGGIILYFIISIKILLTMLMIFFIFVNKLTNDIFLFWKYTVRLHDLY